MKIRHIAEAVMPIALPGEEHKEVFFQLHVFREKHLWNAFTRRKIEHAAWVYGEPANGSLIRVHSECHTGDVFRARNCDCRDQLDFAENEIVNAGSGIIIYMHGQEGRGAGLGNKIRAVNIEPQGYDSIEAYKVLGLPTDTRRYDAAVEIIKHFGLTAITLLTNNLEKIKPFEKAGIKVRQRSCAVEPGS